MSREPGDSVVSGSGDDPTDLALLSYRQGDVLPELRSLAVLRMDDRGRLEVPTEQRSPSLLRRLPFMGVMRGRAGHLLTRFFGGRPLRWVEQSTSDGAVLISQTCDVVRPRRERPTVQAAKLSRLEAERARAAADGLASLPYQMWVRNGSLTLRSSEPSTSGHSSACPAARASSAMIRYELLLERWAGAFRASPSPMKSLIRRTHFLRKCKKSMVKRRPHLVRCCSKSWSCASKRTLDGTMPMHRSLSL